MGNFETRVAAVAVLLASAGCATRNPTAWRIEGPNLAPPGRPRPIGIRTRVECPSGAGAIIAHRKGGRLLLEIDHDALAKQPAGWLADWSTRAEGSGCVTAGEGWSTAHRILDSTPIRLGLRYRLLHPAAGLSGYVDLGEQTRLEAISSVTAGVVPSVAEAPATVKEVPGGLQVEMRAPPDLRVERGWYAVGKGSIRPIGNVPHPEMFAAVRASLWRLIYKSDQSTILVGADSLPELQATTAAVGGGTSSCAKCIEIPRGVGVNPFQAVQVNGSEVRVPLGATLRVAIRAAGKKPEEVIPTLAITKRYEGRMIPLLFERTNPDVLDLVLEGNEVLSW